MKHLTGKSSIRPFVISVLALISILLVAGCGATEDTGGRLEITETYHDFGQAPVNTPVEYAFEIKNTGTGPLNLQELDVKLLEGC